MNTGGNHRSLSYASGASTAPLIGQTIGDNFDRAVARYHDREALIECATGRRWTYQQLRDEGGIRAATGSHRPVSARPALDCVNLTQHLAPHSSQDENQTECLRE